MDWSLNARQATNRAAETIAIYFYVALAREYRRRAKNMATSQKANIFLPASLGILDFRRLSDIIQDWKRAIVNRFL